MLLLLLVVVDLFVYLLWWEGGGAILVGGGGASFVGRFGVGGLFLCPGGLMMGIRTVLKAGSMASDSSVDVDGEDTSDISSSSLLRFWNLMFRFGPGDRLGPGVLGSGYSVIGRNNCCDRLAWSVCTLSVRASYLVAVDVVDDVAQAEWQVL